jgi:hypothetical protein
MNFVARAKLSQQLNDGKIAITELETVIDNKSKIAETL